MEEENPASVLQAINSLAASIDKRVDNACKKQRLGEAVTFKNDGNKDQYLHSVELLKLVERATEDIEQGDILAAQGNLATCIGRLVKRQKLIKLADRSPSGWSTVKEYIADNLAEDEEDEKRLRKVLCSFFQKLHQIIKFYCTCDFKRQWKAVSLPIYPPLSRIYIPFVTLSFS